MNKGAMLWLLVLAAVIYWRKTVESLSINPIDALNDQNVQAFLSMIGQDESHGDYYILYGGGHFTDTSTHPNVKVPFYNPNRAGPEGVPNDFSTAAGKYQINHPTWLLWSAVPGTPNDFTPESQDYLAVTGLQLIGALSDIIAGNFSAALDTASGTWASLPGSTAQQNPKTLQVATNQYLNFGGSIAA